MMIIHDPLYGSFEVPQEIEAIINHPIFKRLQDIKQLGVLHCIMPEAELLTRSAHCIGTYFCAKQMLKSLQINTFQSAEDDTLKEERLPEVYERAVLIAALCHDIGHGPFSHSWEYVADDYNHERMALPCINVLMNAVDDYEEFEVLWEDEQHGIDVIKAIIIGDETFPRKSVPDKFSYIFEIVNNRKCKVDVDKWDYLKRDYLILSNKVPYINMDFDDVFQKARISSCGKHVEYRTEDLHKIYRIFEARHKMHVHCYNLPLSVACNQLLKLSLDKADIEYDIPDEPQNAESTQFVRFTDKFLWPFIIATKYGKYLLNVDKIVYKPFLNDEREITEEYEGIFANTEVLGPGIEMPSNENFNLYGDPNLIEHFERDCVSVRCGGYFQLLPLKDNPTD